MSRPKSQAKAQAYITRMKKADVLVLDDLGAELGIKIKLVRILIMTS